MEYIAIFNDYTDDGKPIFAIHDEYENYLFSVVIPYGALRETEFEIGQEFRIIPQ